MLLEPLGGRTIEAEHHVVRIDIFAGVVVEHNAAAADHGARLVKRPHHIGPGKTVPATSSGVV